MSETYTKDQLVELSTTHLDLSVRQSAAELLYTKGVKEGGLQMIAVTRRALTLAEPATNTQMPS